MPLLPRYHRQQLAAEDQRNVDRVVREAEVMEQPATVQVGATAAGDWTRLRGVPAIGRGVRGAVRGSVPHIDGLGGDRR